MANPSFLIRPVTYFREIMKKRFKRNSTYDKIKWWTFLAASKIQSPPNQDFGLQEAGFTGWGRQTGSCETGIRKLRRFDPRLRRLRHPQTRQKLQSQILQRSGNFNLTFIGRKKIKIWTFRNSKQRWHYFLVKTRPFLKVLYFYM